MQPNSAGRVLVVDDSEYNLDLLARFLAGESFDVVTATGDGDCPEASIPAAAAMPWPRLTVFGRGAREY